MKPAEQQPAHQQNCCQPPDPMDATGAVPMGTKFILDECLIIKLIFGNTQVTGVGSFRPTGMLVRTTGRTGLGPPRHVRSTAGAGFGRHFYDE